MSDPPSLASEDSLDALEMDFGGIDVRIFRDEGMARVIYSNLKDRRGRSADWKDEKSEKTWYDYVFAYDDDNNRNPYVAFDDDAIDVSEHPCRRVSWHRGLHVDCNSVHEVDMEANTWQRKAEYIGQGGFREAFFVGDPKGEDFVVFKQQRIDGEYDDEAYEYMRLDSYVMELFQANPLFLDLYGSCGLSQLIEPMPNGDLEAVALPIQTSRSKKVSTMGAFDSLNNLTVAQKLTFSIEMAEAIAFMHNYPGGVIVHDDVHLGQFLLTKDDQHLKIQDFNRAEILLWDDKNQKYCGYKNGKGHGDVSHIRSSSLS
jgi:hypothetical protein